MLATAFKLRAPQVIAIPERSFTVALFSLLFLLLEKLGRDSDGHAVASEIVRMGRRRQALGRTGGEQIRHHHVAIMGKSEKAEHAVLVWPS